MSGKLPPTSPLKNQPPSKRPNSSLGDRIETRGAAAAINIPVTLRSFGSLTLTPLSCFDGVRLPTNGEILERLFHVRDHVDTKNNLPLKYMVNLIYPEIEAIYAKVPCPMKRKDTCISKIEKVYKRWQEMDKIGPNTSSSTISAYQEELSRLCDLSAQDAIEMIRKDRARDSKQQEEDVKFLQSQKTDREAKMAPTIDKSFSERQQRIEKRRSRSTASKNTSDSTLRTDQSED